MKFDSWVKKLGLAGFAIGVLINIPRLFIQNNLGLAIGYALGTGVALGIVFGVIGFVVDKVKKK